MINTQVSSTAKYFHQLRMPLVSLTKGNPAHILEIGCAAGQTLAYYKKNGAKYVAGIEISPQVADIARTHTEIDRVIVGNIESLDLDFPQQFFDLIVAGHVLEHLVDPWAVLRKLNLLLKPQGQLIGALPNIRHQSVILPLLASGKWQYKDSGIMDWTHLRFFSRSTISDLLTSTGFSIDTIVPEFAGPRSTFVNKLTLGTAKHFLAYAYNFSATTLNSSI